MADFVTLDNAALTELLQGPNGPVHADIQRRTLRVHAKAVENCPVDTGRLRSSIRWAMIKDERGVVGIVGSDVEYAGYVEDGTKRMAGRHFLRDALEEAGG